MRRVFTFRVRYGAISSTYTSYFFYSDQMQLIFITLDSVYLDTGNIILIKKQMLQLDVLYIFLSQIQSSVVNFLGFYIWRTLPNI